jgi:cbb3-type cytochrome oxidase cytochrome c subunit
MGPLLLGILGTFFFSWAGLALVPNFQIGHLDPQSDEEGTDIYPTPKSGMADHGRRVYAANGCVYCHTQQVRPDYAASDIERKWGERRSAPRDYLFERPTFLGKMRMGPDLANVGKRAPVTDANAPEPAAASASTTQSSGAAAQGGTAGTPAPASGAGATSPAPAGAAVAAQPAAAAPPAAAASSPPAAPQAGPASPSSTNVAVTAASSSDNQVGPDGSPIPYSAGWHHKHLYAPRSVNRDSTMPSFAFLYEKKRVEGEYSAEALRLSGSDAPEPGWEIVPSYDAKCLVAYLMSLDQSHALKEVKNAAGPPSPPAPGKKTQ